MRIVNGTKDPVHVFALTHSLSCSLAPNETIWGGYSQLARLLADSLVHVPAGISAIQAMAVGTAGFTAMLGMMGAGAQWTQAQREGGGGYRRRRWRRVDSRCFAGGKRLQSGSLNRAPGASLVAARSWSHHHC